MGWILSQNIRGFAKSQPPLLVFTLCLMSFGLTMVVLAYLIGENEVPNPDIGMDWNKFLEKITKLELCLPPEHLKSYNTNPSAKMDISQFSMNRTDNSTNYRFVDETNSMNAVLSSVVDHVAHSEADNTTIVNVSVNILIMIYSERRVLNSTPSFIQGSIRGKQLGLNGKLADQILNVSLTLPALWNVTCAKWCRVLRRTCLSIHMPSQLVPHTRSPEKCDVYESHIDDSASVNFVEHNKIPSNKACQEGGQLHLEYVPDIRLTEMLSIHERSIVNLHLMHTSYFMFVMVITLLGYAFIKGKYRSPAPIALEKPLLSA